MRVLIINDDVEDSIRIQRRLPTEWQVEITTQSMARNQKTFAYDIIVLDNDANNLQEAKGPETLAAINKTKPDAEIFYTSFQPGMVGRKVYKTRGVQVVKTDKLPEILEKTFQIKLQPEEDKVQVAPQITLMITYNGVRGYKEGVYNNGQLIILSFDKHAGEMAKEVLREKLRKIYATFEWRADRDIIKNIFVYDGINGGEWPARLAAVLGHDIRMKVQLCACDCEWSRKLRTSRTYYVDLYKCECGGERTLGKIADLVLGIKRPDADYANVPVPVAIIENGAEKFKL